jgi:hypothetical protein
VEHQEEGKSRLHKVGVVCKAEEFIGGVDETHQRGYSEVRDKG